MLPLIIDFELMIMGVRYQIYFNAILNGSHTISPFGATLALCVARYYHDGLDLSNRSKSKDETLLSAVVFLLKLSEFF